METLKICRGMLNSSNKTLGVFLGGDMQMFGDDNDSRKMLEYTSTSNTKETSRDTMQ